MISGFTGNPQNRFEVGGVSCDKCGCPLPVEELVLQDGLLICPSHVRAHPREELDFYAEMNSGEDIVSETQFGGANGVDYYQRQFVPGGWEY